MCSIFFLFSCIKIVSGWYWKKHILPTHQQTSGHEFIDYLIMKNCSIPIVPMAATGLLEAKQQTNRQYWTSTTQINIEQWIQSWMTHSIYPIMTINLCATGNYAGVSLLSAVYFWVRRHFQCNEKCMDRQKYALIKGIQDTMMQNSTIFRIYVAQNTFSPSESHNHSSYNAIGSTHIHTNSDDNNYGNFSLDHGRHQIET